MGCRSVHPNLDRRLGQLDFWTNSDACQWQFRGIYGANAGNLTKPGIPLTIYAYSSPQATNP